MLVQLLLGLSLTYAAPKDSLKSFHDQLEFYMIKMGSAPNANMGDSCYHFTELVKVEINKFGKVISITLSDSAPYWMKKNLDALKEQKRINYEKLNAIAKSSGLQNYTLVFPFIMESDYFPCGNGANKRALGDNYFRFNGRSLKGNVFFGDPIEFIFPVRTIK